MSIPRTNNFDLIRLLAAIQVVILHAALLLKPQSNPAYEFLGKWLYYFPGVPIFFTTSGFLVYWSFERNSDRIGQFFKNRFLRIYPALWVSFAVTIVLLLMFREITLSTFGRMDFLGWMIRQVTFFQFGTPDILRHWGDGQVNRSLWTISVELQFYLLLPIIYFFMKRFKQRELIGWGILFFGSIAAFILVSQLSPDNIIRKLSWLCVVSYLFNFLMGIGFYLWWDRLRYFIENRFVYWLAAYFLYVLVFGKWLGWYQTWPYTPEPIRMLGYALLSAMTMSFAFSYNTMSEKLLRGYDISYGIYIYHGLVLNCFIAFGWEFRWNWLPVGVLAVSCILSVLSWVYVEKPFLRLKSRNRPVLPSLSIGLEEQSPDSPVGAA
jgi:peptidoglycan/LPS O-acetylase OafA/YrhL